MDELAGPGYLYALINPAMPGLVKVGRTVRVPTTRVAELTSATGVPAPFELVYDVFVPDVEAAERFVHRALTEQGYRLADNREFFRAPIIEVVRLFVVLREKMESASLARSRAIESATLERDKRFLEAAELCIRSRGGTTELIKRRLGIGYGRAARIVDQLYDAGILGPPDGDRPRAVLVGLNDLSRFVD